MTYENVLFILGIIYLIIFISLIAFCCTLKYWGEKAKKFVKEFVIVYCCFNIFMVWTNHQAAVEWTSSSAKKKSCFTYSKVYLVQFFPLTLNSHRLHHYYIN